MNKPFSVLICIPSYARFDVLKTALDSITRVVKDDTRFSFHGYVYAQGYETVPDVDSMWHIENVPHVVRPIGGIMRDSVLEGLKHYDKNFDFIIMSDDDVELREHKDNGEWAVKDFVDNLYKVLNDMQQNNIAVGSAKIAHTYYGFAKADFPQEDWYVPFKERFILLKNGSNVEKILSKRDMDTISHGEDLYTFLKAAALKLPVRLYYGLDNWIHIPHVDQADDEPLPVIDGGYTQLVSAYNEGVSPEKSVLYETAERLIGKSVYGIFPGAIDRSNPWVNPAKDFDKYVEDHVQFDENYNVGKHDN